MAKHLPFANTADDIRRLVAADPHAARALEAAHARAHDWMASFADDASRPSGWAHNFCCPACAAQLTFDPHLAFSPPNTFVCPRCGAQATGQDLDEAWTYYYRNRSAADLEAVAVCALLGEEEAYAYLARYLDFYASHYAEFPVHGRWAGKGKLAGQGLDEAVWAVAVLRAVNASGQLARVDEARRRFWHEALFAPLADLLIPQSHSYNNISLWLMCACANIALTFGDDALLALALDSDFGIRHQVAKGYTRDGVWRECSFTYHYYTVESLTYFASLFAVSHPDDPLLDLFGRIFTAPLALSFDGARLPALNDGWYPLSVDSLALLFLRARRFVDSPEIIAVTERFRERGSNTLERPASLLVRVAEPVSSAHRATPSPRANVEILTDTNLAGVRAPVHAIFKSGVLIPNHMHRDYNSLIIPPFSDDLGTPGYGHPMTHSWYRQGASHNLVTVDGLVTDKVLPSRIERTPKGLRGVVDVSDLEGFERAERSLELTDKALVDRCDYACAGEHVFDWIFHAKGSASFSCASQPAAPLGNVGGYEHFREVRRLDVAAGECLVICFELEGKTLRLETTLAPGMEAFTALSPDNPADASRTAVILRLRGARAHFEVRFANA